MITWRERLDRANKRGYFTRKDVSAAERWSTCAVGEAFGTRGEPEDEKLCDLGMRFLWAVLDHDMDRAERLYKEILWMSGVEACREVGIPVVKIMEQLEKQRD